MTCAASLDDPIIVDAVHADNHEEVCSLGFIEVGWPPAPFVVKKGMLLSNPMYLSRTRFETLDRSGVVISTTYGARIYDDIGCAYSNLLDSEEELRALDAGALVEYMRDSSETAKDMIDLVLELGDPFYVDDELYAGDDADEEQDFDDVDDQTDGDGNLDNGSAMATGN